LAKLLSAPVILVIDCTKTTRTMAALVSGCQRFDADVDFAGVVLNRIVGKRHREVITQAIESECGLPVLGAIPRLTAQDFLIPGRHLGLVPPSEFATSADLIAGLTKLAVDYLDTQKLMEIAATAPEITFAHGTVQRAEERRVRIGYFSDPVFTFYYPENLEALEAHGAELIPISSLATRQLPQVDGLYIGGGFPETFAEKLAANGSLMSSVRRAAIEGVPVYAECGGLIYLCKSLQHGGSVYPMSGVFPLELKMSARPAGHGYTIAEVDRENPFFEIGMRLRGHEFHYSHICSSAETIPTCLAVERGTGIGAGRDGLVGNSTFAAYMHLHADSVPGWAKAFVKAAGQFGHGTEAAGDFKNEKSDQVRISPVLMPGVSSC
jgi:cobyrinic acid a,c-diamide synthase